MLNLVQEQLNEVKEKILQACERVGRNPSEVKLIAVSKTKPVSMIEEAIACGQTVFGENKVQELCDKIPQLPVDLEWHLIGHLQRNKVKYIVDKVALIHSVDTVRLAKQISQEAVKAGVRVKILLEVNVAREESKFGFMEEEVEEAVREIATFPNIQIVGLMTIAPFVTDPEENRIYFKKLHQLCVDIGKKNIDNIRMSELSMGMTGDYEVAIEEGATMVRVGTGIFGTR
ncbi:hypothetical protein NDGK_01711 [Clostridiales bacterium CHKCI001]|nr:hypothetical protein NDGK_01711 [Clostridiales bacterium CHKCI001]